MLQVVVERRVRGLYINMEEGSSQARTFNRFNATQPKETKQCFNSMERRTVAIWPKATKAAGNKTMTDTKIS